jgi:hypothetical protein
MSSRRAASVARLFISVLFPSLLLIFSPTVLNSLSLTFWFSAPNQISLRRCALSKYETPPRYVPSNEWTLPTESPPASSRIFRIPLMYTLGGKFGKLLMKSSLAFLFLLLFAASAQAQHSHSFSSSSIINQGGGYGGGYSGGWDGYGAGGYGYGAGGSHHHGGLRYEAPREFSTGCVTNDGPYVPSTFMNYNEALALGQQQLAAAKPAQAETGPSLGDVARAYRAARNSTQAPPTRALQDNSGRLHICNLNGDNCRQP